MIIGIFLITVCAIAATGFHSKEILRLFFIFPFLSRKVLTQKTTTTYNSEKRYYNDSSKINLEDRCIKTSTPISMLPPRKLRIVVGMTGATGALYTIKLLQKLRRLDIETHLVISHWADATTKYETDMKVSAIRKFADRVYSINDQAASISSGSFLHDGMIIVPCSMKTVAAIRSGYCEDLISRAADVTIKERRKLILAIRETPLSVIHLDNMLFLARAGVVIFPPVPAFYTRPKTIDDIVEQTVGRMLDSLDIHADGFERWDGMKTSR